MHEERTVHVAEVTVALLQDLKEFSDRKLFVDFECKYGQRCNGRRFLQRQHVIPWAKSGEHRELKVLCASCNLQEAIREYGATWMKKYLGNK